MADDAKKQLAQRIEEMAHSAFDLPKDERSRKGAEEMAGMLIELSGLELEKTEEPFMARLRPGGGSGGAKA